MKKIIKIYNLIYLLIFGKYKYAKKIGVKIGKNCRVYTIHFGSEPFLVSIGNNVTITSGVKFLTHDGSAWLFRDQKGRRYLYQKIEINDNVFIGVNSIIMPGVKIEKNVIVAAGSVVTKSIPSGSIVAGVPAKIIGKFEDLENKMLNTYISDSDLNKKLNYKNRILEVLTSEFKPYL